MLFWIHFIFSLFFNAEALQATICDCSKSEHKGVIGFQESGCKPKNLVGPPETVDHVVYTYQEESISFPGYICSRWFREADVVGGLFGSTTALMGRRSMHTTPEECWSMIKLKKCGEHHMEYSSNGIWRWDQDPSVDVGWGAHIINKALNCLFEEITLVKKCEDCAISSPFGSLDPVRYKGNVSQHSMTLVWNVKDLQVVKPCELKIIKIGRQSRLRKLSSGHYQLRNNEQQEDFIIVPNNDTTTDYKKKTEVCGKNGTFFKVLGMKKIVIALSRPKMTEKEHENNLSAANLTTNSELEIAVDEASHAQYNRDAVIEGENILVNELQYLLCELRKTHHSMSIALSQYNSWSAASRMQLPVCSKLNSVGNSVIITQCTSKIVNFTTVLDGPCGPQLFYNNFTIGITGWELVKFKSCYHTSNFVNINGIAHHYTSGTWQPVPVDLEMNEHHLTSMFTTMVDNAFNYTSRRNEGTQQQSLDHIAVVADIIAEMHEVHSGTGNAGVPHVSNVLAEQNSNKFFSWLTGDGWIGSIWLRALEFVKIAVLVFLCIFIIAILCKFLPFLIYLLKMCKPSKKLQNIDLRDYQMSLLKQNQLY